MHAKRNRVSYLQPAQQRFLLRRLSAAFVEMTGALKCRPEPRAMFDNVAREEGAARPKGYDAVLAGQIVMKAAIQQGDPTVIEDTARRVAHYFDELRAAALTDYLERSHGAEALLVDASRETSEATHALTLAALRPRCRATLERAAREARQAIDHLCRWAAGAEREVMSGSSTAHQNRADARP
ncbi:MAG: hypothetical protein H0X64_13790 [Gemmatimonadaceae bacterium]|nr:hypothetical protein [Gemmatimonadaceae bacterium]